MAHTHTCMHTCTHTHTEPVAVPGPLKWLVIQKVKESHSHWLRRTVWLVLISDLIGRQPTWHQSCTLVWVPVLSTRLAVHLFGHRASPPFNGYQFILLGDRGTWVWTTCPRCCYSPSHKSDALATTHTQTQSFDGSSGFCPGLHEWASSRKVKPIWIYWNITLHYIVKFLTRDSERQWHLLGHIQICTAPQADNHANIQIFLQAGCPSCRPTNNVKALKA